MTNKILKCPACGWLIDRDKFTTCRLDYGCPKCKTSFHEFKISNKLNMKITKRQKEALIAVKNDSIFYVKSPTPFKRESSYQYTSLDFANRTFEKLLALKLIKHELIYSGIASSKHEVKLTKAGKEYLIKNTEV